VVRLGLALSTVMNAWNVINMIAAAVLETGFVSVDQQSTAWCDPAV